MTNITNTYSNNTNNKTEDESTLKNINCLQSNLQAFETKYYSFQFSNQNGFPPEHYNFIFEIDNGNRKEIFYLIENNLIGSFSEIPLISDARFYLMKQDYKFEIKIQAQAKIIVNIKIEYYKGPYFNNDYTDSFILDCRGLVIEKPQNTNIDQIISKR